MRVCACGCGVEFTPRKSTGIYASTACRVRAARARAKQAEDSSLAADASVVALAGRRKPKPAGAASVVAAVTSELGSAVSSSLGQQALILAERIDSRIDSSGSAVAALSKQLVVLTAAALRDATPDVAVDPVAAIQAQVIAMRQANAG